MNGESLTFLFCLRWSTFHEENDMSREHENCTHPLDTGVKALLSDLRRLLVELYNDAANNDEPTRSRRMKDLLRRVDRALDKP